MGNDTVQPRTGEKGVGGVVSGEFSKSRDSYLVPPGVRDELASILFYFTSLLDCFEPRFPHL